MKVAFIGLGVMGMPMAGHLANSGHEVCVYNRTRSLRQINGLKPIPVAPPIPLRWSAESAEVVFCCVGNDDDLRAVTLGDQGAFKGMQSDAVFVDHTTASALVARELATAASDYGLHFLDAPVSGGQAGAENGILTIMVGGESTILERVRDAINCYAKAVTLMGDVGAGQLTKMVNQICIAGLVQGLSEGINFAQKAGLDAKLAVDVISKGAAQSWQMENRGNTMVDDQFDFGFAVDWMRKDLGLCIEQARQNGGATTGGGLGRSILCPGTGAWRWALGYFKSHPFVVFPLAIIF